MDGSERMAGRNTKNCVKNAENCWGSERCGGDDEVVIDLSGRKGIICRNPGCLLMFELRLARSWCLRAYLQYLT